MPDGVAQQVLQSLGECIEVATHDTILGQIAAEPLDGPAAFEACVLHQQVP